MDANNANENFDIVTSATRIKKKPDMLESVNPSTSNNLGNTSTTKIGHDFDPEKRKSPSKRRSIVKPKRKPQAQGYYRRRLEYFDKKQNGTKEDVAIFSEASSQGLDMIPRVMDGQIHPQLLFPLYHKAVNSYLDASLKLRQTILTERKLAAEVWGDNSIASYDNGIYTVQKDVIEDLLKPRTEEFRHVPARKAAPRKRKPSPQETVQEAIIQSDPDVDDYDITDFIEFSDNMAVTRSQTKAIRKQVEVEPPPPPPPVPAPSAAASKGKRKPAASSNKELPQPKKTRFAKDTSNTPTPPPTSLPPPPPPLPKQMKKNLIKIKETPMPSFKMITENKISRGAQEIIKDLKVMQCLCKSDVACNNGCLNRDLRMECGSRCPVGQKCQNKRFQKREYASFEPFFAGIKGWGIRATKPIQKGDFIVEYVGDVVDSYEMTKRQNRYNKNNHKHHYMMSLRNGAVIDATSCGNYSRFVNHSCDPNAETQKWVVSREMRIGFFAKKNIAKGEEIVFDYAFERFGKDAQECFCGSENCTGFIGSKPNEEENDEEEAESSESTSEASDDETIKDDTTTVVKKVQKPKRTEEEKEMRKRMAKARRKLVKARREFRKVIGRKKNFSSDDVLEFNRQMYRINDYDQRFLIINFLLTFPDEQWKKYFIEKNGIEVVWSWLTDYTGSVRLKTFVRLQNGLIKFLDTLPIEYNDHLKSILILLKDLKDVHLPDDIILQETLNELVDCVVSDEPEIADKDLARMMERDKVSMIKLYDETVEICKRLYEDWSKLPSLLTEGCVEISGDEMEESRVVVELPSDEPAVNETATSPHASSSPEMMDTDFDTPEHISQPVDDIDIGAKKHFGSSSPDDERRSEKENSHRKKFRSRSRSRSYSPKRRQRSRSRSPIGYAKFLNNAIKKDYRYRDDRRKYDRDFDRRDRRYDGYYRTKHHNDRHAERYRGDRHYESRRYEDRRHDRHRDHHDHHYDSRHRSHRHHDYHHSDRHSHSRQRSSKSHERRKNYSISPVRISSPHNSRKESPVREHRSKSNMAKSIKIEIPETSPVIKSESPPEISPAVVASVPSLSISTQSVLTNPPVVSSKSNTGEVSFEAVFPEAVAPLPVPPPSTQMLTMYSAPPPDLPGTGPKFRSTMHFQGFANTRPTRPPPIRFSGFKNAPSRPVKIPTVRLPIVFPPLPPQFLPHSSLSNQQWFGYPTTFYPIPPPPPSNIGQQIPTQSAIPQPLQIPLPAEPTVPDPQPSFGISEQSVRDYYESSSVTSSKEIKREEFSPAVSDPIQSQPTPEEAQNDEEEVEKSKLKPYEKNPDWIETYTDDGIIYYYHKETRETSWEEPPPKAPEKIAPKPVFHQSKGSKRPECVQIDDVELKKQFKLKIWQNIYKYLKPRNEMTIVDEGTLTQFARKMTHKCLDVELKNGNKNLEITEKVYLRARQITDQHYAQFVTETRTIKAEPLH